MSKPVPLQYGSYYHIYNRGNNRENIFVEDKNYTYFLNRYAAYVEPVADTYAYCLLRNHFHVLVRIKTVAEQETWQSGATPSSVSPFVPKAPSQQFGNLFNAYAKAINKAYHRTGSLFQHPFRRILVTSEAYFIRLVIYIHQNPQHHRFVEDFRTWPYSSYHALLSESPTHLQRQEVLRWFGGAENVRVAHQRAVEDLQLAMLALED